MIFRIFFSSLKIAIEKILNHADIVLLSVLLVVVDRLVGFDGVSIRGEPFEVAKSVFYNISSGRIIGILIVSIVLKGLLIVAVGRDLFNLSTAGGWDRVFIFLRSCIVSESWWNGVFCVGWYLAFFCVGFFITFASTAFDDFVVSWLFVVFFGVLLFPVFYAGFSVVGFFYVARSLGERMGNFLPILRTKFFEIYAFYSMRAIFEFSVIGAAFWLVGQINRVQNGWYVVVFEMILVSVVVAISRVATVSYKLDLFNVEALKKRFSEG